jgi:hypothetical protein
MGQRAAQAAGDERGAAVEGDHCERVAGEQPGEPGEQLAVPGVPCNEALVAVGDLHNGRRGYPHRVLVRADAMALDPFESRAR